MMNLLTMTEGAKIVARTDPHGLTLTLVSVVVVFGCLFILFLIYSFSGNIFSGKYKRPKTSSLSKDNGEIAAAIAMALEAECGSDVEVAIATALSLELGNGIHDIEPLFITIENKPSLWKNRALTFRKLPNI